MCVFMTGVVMAVFRMRMIVRGMIMRTGLIVVVFRMLTVIVCGMVVWLMSL
nr:hypothetical protein SUGSMm_06130 [Morganella morganii subsp. sibonii]